MKRQYYPMQCYEEATRAVAVVEADPEAAAVEAVETEGAAKKTEAATVIDEIVRNSKP